MTLRLRPLNQLGGGGGGGGGTVTSVDATVPAFDMTVAGVPIVGAGTIVIDWLDGSLHDALGVESVDFYNRFLQDALGNVVAHWDTQELITPAGITTLEWLNGSLLNSTGVTVNWGGYELIDSSSLPVMNWNIRTVIDPAGVNVADWQTNNIFKILNSCILGYVDTHSPPTLQPAFGGGVDFYGTNRDNVMCEPDTWLEVDANGTRGVVPVYYF